jgi:predicted aspartyl protease
MNPVPYTQTYPKPALCIATTCKISEPYDAAFDTGEHPPYIELSAIWDTGAMRSTISTQIAERLNLIPLGQTRVCHADGESICNYYVVNLLLPNRIEIKMLMVNDGKLTDTDMLIGMDIISLCDLTITSPGPETKFSFQIPSNLDIDFEKQV